MGKASSCDPVSYKMVVVVLGMWVVNQVGNGGSNGQGNKTHQGSRN